MNNFIYANPTKIIFGKGMIKEIANEIPKDKKVLICYGGGSIKKNGVYEQVTQALSKHKVVEFGGIEPNPHYETCLKVVDLIKKEKVDFLLAVGGGSVLDATKFIAAASLFEDGEPWNILLTGGQTIKNALPLASVMTLPATGSEMNSGGVISRAETAEKLSFASDFCFPQFSVLDPETTFTLPTRQLTNGVVDSFIHVIEQYLTRQKSTLQDNMAEAILKTIVTDGPKTIEQAKDYDLRANFVWAATWALNGWINCGVEQDWSTHMIGHELTAITGLDHAQTLAIVLPGVMEAMKQQKAEKIKQLGKNVFNLPCDGNLIENTIKTVEQFFNKIGMKTRLSDHNIKEDTIKEIVERFKKRGWKLGEGRNIDYQVIETILKSRL